jgi:hypothetical protein
MKGLSCISTVLAFAKNRTSPHLSISSFKFLKSKIESFLFETLHCGHTLLKSNDVKAYISGTRKGGLPIAIDLSSLYFRLSLEKSGQTLTIKQHAPLKNLKNHKTQIFSLYLF